MHQYNRHIGHARYVAELASIFKKDHEVHVFTSVWEEPDPNGIIFHKVPAWRWRTLTCVLTFILPATLMIGNKFDVVHAQGLCGFRHSVTTAHFIQSKWIKRLKNQGKSLGFSTWIWKWIVGSLENFALGPFCSKRVIAISQAVQRDLSFECSIKDNIDLYSQARIYIQDMQDDGIIISGIPIKLHTLKEKAELITNIDQCLLNYNKWISVKQPSYAIAYSPETLTQVAQIEHTNWVSTGSANKSLLTYNDIPKKQLALSDLKWIDN